MSVGFGFLHAMLRDNISPARLDDFRCSPAMFRGSEEDALQFITDFYSNYNTLPTLAVVEAEVGPFPELPESPIEYWADQVRSRWAHSYISRSVQGIAELLADGDIEGAKERLQSIAVGARSYDLHNRVAPASEYAREVIERHAMVQGASGLIGVSFGFPFLDQVTGGAQPGDFIIVVGRPGTGKTYLLLKMALAAIAQGRKVLFLTMEMTALQIVSRLLAMHTGVTHTLLRHGKLSYFAVQVLEQAIDTFDPNNNLIIMPGGLARSVTDLALRVKEQQPHVVLVDGAYLVRPGERSNAKWEKVTLVAEALKTIGIGEDIPIIASYQQGRGAEGKAGGSLGTIGYSDAIGQLASIGIDIDDEDKDAEFSIGVSIPKIVSIIKGREGEYGAFRALFNMRRTQITQDEILVSREE